MNVHAIDTDSNTALHAIRMAARAPGAGVPDSDDNLGQLIGAPTPAPGAHEAVRPAAGCQVRLAGLITGKLRLKLT
jgi:hypothetical protein